MVPDNLRVSYFFTTTLFHTNNELIIPIDIKSKKQGIAFAEFPFCVIDPFSASCFQAHFNFVLKQISIILNLDRDDGRR